MISRCNQNDKTKIISYIDKDYPSCLYLYLDLKKYDLNTGLVDAYFLHDEANITGVILKYYSCLHVYSRNNNFDALELGRFIDNNNFSMIYCESDTASKIIEHLPSKVLRKTTITSGWVAQIKKIDKEPKGFSEPACESDFQQIAELIFSDEDIGKSYNFDDLTRQLIERYKEGYARNIVIKKDDWVIAHACTNAEIENIAVVAELLVRREYRKRGYASEIWREICAKLLSEGKEVYSFYYSEESRNLHKHIGFIEICEWTKIVIS